MFSNLSIISVIKALQVFSNFGYEVSILNLGAPSGVAGYLTERMFTPPSTNFTPPSISSEKLDKE